MKKNGFSQWAKMARKVHLPVLLNCCFFLLKICFCFLFFSVTALTSPVFAVQPLSEQEKNELLQKEADAHCVPLSDSEYRCDLCNRHFETLQNDDNAQSIEDMWLFKNAIRVQTQQERQIAPKRFIPLTANMHKGLTIFFFVLSLWICTKFIMPFFRYT